jgi:uncharacterized membrane protein
MRLGFQPLALVAIPIIFGSDLLWLGCATSVCYAGYRTLRDGPGAAVSSHTKLAAILAHAVVAGGARSLIICDSLNEAAGIGALVGFYTYFTFNITMCGMVPWGTSTWLPDIIYGTVLWTTVSIAVYQIAS